MEQLRFERSVMKNNTLEIEMQKTFEIAISLKNSDTSVPNIAKHTGLFEKEIENL